MNTTSTALSARSTELRAISYRRSLSAGLPDGSIDSSDAGEACACLALAGLLDTGSLATRLGQNSRGWVSGSAYGVLEVMIDRHGASALALALAELMAESEARANLLVG